MKEITPTNPMTATVARRRSKTDGRKTAASARFGRKTAGYRVPRKMGASRWG